MRHSPGKLRLVNSSVNSNDAICLRAAFAAAAACREAQSTCVALAGRGWDGDPSDVHVLVRVVSSYIRFDRLDGVCLCDLREVCRVFALAVRACSCCCMVPVWVIWRRRRQRRQMMRTNDGDDDQSL